jgi:hypothetical protein
MRNLSSLTFAGLMVALTLAANGPPTDKNFTVRAGNLPETDRIALSTRFARSIWPMMSEPDDPSKACIACHRDDGSNTSPLVLSGEPFAVFARLLADGYFDKGQPSSILSRVAHKRPSDRMPPVPARPWSAEEIAVLGAFVEEVAAKRIQ